jgi:hypothetical protein
MDIRKKIKIVFTFFSLTELTQAQEGHYSKVYLYQLKLISLKNIMDVPVITIANGYKSTLKNALAIAPVITIDQISCPVEITIDKILESTFRAPHYQTIFTTCLSQLYNARRYDIAQPGSYGHA